MDMGTKLWNVSKDTSWNRLGKVIYKNIWKYVVEVRWWSNYAH